MAVSGILTLAWASPGPNMLAVIDATLNSGQKAGFKVGLGISVGNIVWSLLAVAGLGILFETHPEAMLVVQAFGCVYLSFLGFKSLQSALKKPKDINIEGNLRGTSSHFISGLIVIFTNPKAILFFASIFATLIPENAGPFWKAIVVSLSGTIPAVGHFLTSYFMSRPGIVTKYLKAQQTISTVFAVAFFYLAANLGTSLLFN